MMPIIGAIVCNVHLAQPEIEFEIIHSVNDEWFTNDERQVWPFWTSELGNVIDLCNVIIPEGWIEHLHEEARKLALLKPSPSEAKPNGTSLLAALGLPTKVHSNVSGKLVRRI